MNNTIYKLPLEITTSQVIPLPGKNPNILTVTKVDHQIVMYAEVDTSMELYAYKNTEILVLGTGQPYPYPRTEMRYIGTVVLNPFVWHIFVHEQLH